MQTTSASITTTGFYRPITPIIASKGGGNPGGAGKGGGSPRPAPANAPSKTGMPSGPNRGNNPAAPKR